MRLSDVFLTLGESEFGQLIRSISIGKLKTYQIYDGLKTRAHLAKLNTENLRRAIPRFWSRLGEHDEDFAKDLSQAVLVSHLEMIVAVLNFLEIPHEGGFFAKDMNPSRFLTQGWDKRVFEKFRGVYPEALLLFYINHLAWELSAAEEPLAPASAGSG